jgi:ABC-type ATPase involved in cell division/GNAT superfamily N-acetyltransferase
VKPIYEINVVADEFTQAASTAFDYKFEGTSVFEGFEKPEIPEDFSIGLIIGPSGSGKSLLLKEFGQEESIVWEPSKAIVSHFETPDDAINRLTAVGLNTIPSWCKPFHVLSNGEQFRANLARRLKDGAVIDEFTSVVDRNVAKAASNAVRRFIENQGIKKVVFASCHYDILEWLRPDWYFDTVTGILHDGRLLRRPPITLRIYPCTKDSWALFAKHHYLSETFNKAARAYLATGDFGDVELPVGFVSSLPQPSGNFSNGYREHRTVVLPDFQGLGIGPKIADAVAQLHLDDGKRYFSRTAHPRFGAYRDRINSGWKKTAKYRKIRDANCIRKALGGGDNRICYCHEYIGKDDKN